MDEYGKRLVEVYEILKYMPEDEVEKIPEDLKDAIRDGRDENYEWHYDENKKLVEQDVHTDTIAMLSYINMEYILTPEQKKVIEQSHFLNDKIREFKENKEEASSLNNNIKIESSELIIDSPKQSIFSKIAYWFKGVFNK